MNGVTCLLLLLLGIFGLAQTGDMPRPAGVALLNASLYYPRDDKSWVCLDGSKAIRFVQINDDFCDCADGSDEPGTSACTNGRFHCANIGHRPQDIPSSRVNDGICDCCDASDEYASGVECANTCRERGHAEREQRKTEAELHKRGAAKRAELISQGKQLRADREVRRAELERRRSEQERIKAEKEESKRAAEAAESEALEFYKEQQREQEAAAAETIKTEDGTQTMREEAEISFSRYDTNKDGFVEITELQVDISLDRDRDGVVTVEEAKYFLDERERIDLDMYVTLSWPRVKTVQMLAQGIFKPPVVHSSETVNDEKEVDIESEQAHESDEHEEHAGHHEDDEEEGYEDEDADVGVGTVTEEAPATPEYDPETQHLIEVANKARNAHADVEREIREIEQEIKEIDEQTGKDYGPNEEYAAMDGECYKFEDREYVYTLCPFERASQKQQSGGSETTLGRWEQWIGDGANKYAKQRYAHGASCWNGPQRSAIVQLKCALEPRITGVSEPNRCEYFFELETPAACDGGQQVVDDDNLHDEL